MIVYFLVFILSCTNDLLGSYGLLYAFLACFINEIYNNLINIKLGLHRFLFINSKSDKKFNTLLGIEQ